MQTRSLHIELRASDRDRREFTGIGVPYGEIIDVWGGREMFAPGSVRLDAGAPVLWQHQRDTPIGVIVEGRDTPSGFEITARLSDTAAGRDAWTLLKDGATTKLSIGFEPVRYETSTDDEGTVTITHVEARAREFSLVTFPAYESATVTSHRSKDAIMNQPPAAPAAPAVDYVERATVDALADNLTDVTRRMSLLESNAAPAAPALAIRSMGDYMKLLARGDHAALDLHERMNNRAWDAESTALSDSVTLPGPIRDFIKLATSRRRFINLFGTSPLPDTGMNVDYVQVGVDSTEVTVQATEGADLAKGKVTLTPASAPLQTYGGWSELSRQVIERASVNHLDITLRALALRYSKATETAFRAAVLGAIAARGAGSGLALTSATDYEAWSNLLIDAAMLYDDGIYTISGLLVSPDVFKTLAALKTSSGQLLMRVHGEGVNQVGSVDLSGLTGQLASVTVTALPGAPANTAVFWDTVAASWCEAANAPAQLQDENIVNLSKQFSVYGYGGAMVPFPNAFEPVTIGAGV